jgi:hypothetical protein
MIYSNEIAIPNICPLFFGSIGIANETDVYPEAFRYAQKFPPSATIHVQLLATTDRSDATLSVIDYDLGTVKATYTATWTELSTNKWYGDYYIPCSALNGLYNVVLASPTNTLIADSFPFLVGDYTLVKLDVWHQKNDFVTVFGEFGAGTTFTIFYEGGFPPAGRKDNSDYSTFKDAWKQGYFLNSTPQVIKKHVIGDGEGIPCWFEEMIYKFYCCSHLLINNIQYTRSEGFEEVVTAKQTKQLSIMLNETTNRLTQTSEGDIIITDSFGIPIATDVPQILIL